VTSDSVTPPTRGGDRLDRALHVAFDDQRHFLPALRLEVGHHIAERSAHRLASRGELLAPLTLAIFRDLSRARFRFDHRDAVARFRRAGKAEHLDRGRRRRFFDRFALVVDQRPDTAPLRAGDDKRPDPERAALH
jgi:hypothetical protein